MTQIYNHHSTGLRARLLVTCLLLACSLGAFAQTSKISGTVKDANGESIVGANVIVKGTTNGTTSTANGAFNLSGVTRNAILSVSFMGYKAQEIPVAGRTKLEIVLEEDATSIDEVVVQVGYGAARKSDLTGAVSSLSGKEVEGYKSSSVMEALGGQVAGVQITQTEGTPGAGFDVKVRGVGTVNGNASPLYIVDGFQVDNIDYLANSDIESIEILKDASSAAIYGARGANGVVMVTTKSAKVGRPVVIYNGSASFRSLTKKIDVLNPYEYVALQVERDASYAPTYYRQGEDENGNPWQYQSLDDYIGVKGIDWQDEMFRSTWSQNHAVQVTGGTNDSRYNLSISHFGENGIYIGSSFAKTNAKLRINQKIGKFVTVDATVNYMNSDREGEGTSADSGRFNGLVRLIRSRPTGGVRMSDKQLIDSPIDEILASNESGSLAQTNTKIQALHTTNTTFSEMWQANAGITINFTKKLYFRSNNGYTVTNARTDLFYDDLTSQAIRLGAPYGSTQMARNMRYSTSNFLTYKNTFQKKHAVEAVLGQELVFNNNQNLKGEAQEMPFDNLGNDNLGAGALPTLVTTTYGQKRLLSFFARANYGYKGRYLLTTTMRADGSTVFSDDHKWGFFPSFSFAWRVSEEPFMKNQHIFSNLKLRTGWGMVGNDRVTNYLSLDLYSTASYGLGSANTMTLVSKQLPTDLRWEGSQTTNVGVDIGLVDNRIGLTVDAFVKDTKDLLLAVTKSGVTGFTSQWQNVGKVRNKGLEFSVNSANIRKKDFIWTTDFNISLIRNEVVSLAQGETQLLSSANFGYGSNDYISMLGRSVGEMYGYKFDGIYQLSDFNINATTGAYELKKGVTDISAHAGVPVKPGMVKYRDMDGDGIISDNDRTVIGSGIPKFYGGLTNTITCKNIDFSFMFQFSYGNNIYNGNRAFNTTSNERLYNLMGEVADRWTPTNASNKVPSINGYINSELYSRFIEDGSFLRLKALTLGYTLPKHLTRKALIDRVRVYVSGQNLFVVSGYSGYDPEVSTKAASPTTPGVDWGGYPRSRVFTFGLDLQF